MLADPKCGDAPDACELLDALRGHTQDAGYLACGKEFWKFCSGHSASPFLVVH